MIAGVSILSACSLFADPRDLTPDEVAFRQNSLGIPETPYNGEQVEVNVVCTGSTAFADGTDPFALPAVVLDRNRYRVQSGVSVGDLVAQLYPQLASLPTAVRVKREEDFESWTIGKPVEPVPYSHGYSDWGTFTPEFCWTEHSIQYILETRRTFVTYTVEIRVGGVVTD